jgi:hypothetical protein
MRFDGGKEPGQHRAFSLESSLERQPAMPNNQNISRIRTALGDAMSWAARRASSPPVDGDIAGCLRSPQLTPHADRIHAAWFGDPRSQRTVGSGLTLGDSFSALVSDRRALVARRPRPSAAALDLELTRPRALLLTRWELSLHDGAAEVASRGFIDDANVPPCDTWLDLLTLPGATGPDRCLLSWVPSWASDGVDQGVYVVPEGCLTWAEFAGGAIAARPWGELWKGAALSGRQAGAAPRYGNPEQQESALRRRERAERRGQGGRRKKSRGVVTRAGALALVG